MPSNARRILITLAVASLIGVACTSEETTGDDAAADELLAGFVDPPQSARPRTWWHWMNGNITQDGIAKDLAWMRDVGLGGVQNFDAALGTPQVVQQRLVYMDPDWQEALRFALKTADDYGLEYAIAASPGWSETGGPWVPPQDGMKKLVWSVTDISGGQPYEGRLPAPPGVTGAFQDLPFHDALAAIAGHAEEKPQHYADAIVLAFPAGNANAPAAARATAVNGDRVDAAALMDGSLTTGVEIPAGDAANPGTLVITYPGEQTLHSATLFVEDGVAFFGDAAWSPVLEARVGNAWKHVADVPVSEVPVTVSFAPVTASQFRLVLLPFSGAERIGLGEGAPGAAPGFAFPPVGGDTARVMELKMGSQPLIDRFEAKAGFDVVRDYYALQTNAGDDAGVSPDEVIDLTDRLGEDGSLDWTPPPGNWRVLRLGYSLLGTTNHPATAEATGLEVDKYDKAAVRRYLETYLSMYRDAAGGDWVGDPGLDAILTDSIEVGASNWTGNMVEHFRELRGYDPIPWLPALTGVIVGSRAESDAFLYDFRRTLGDLLVSQHYGTVRSVAEEHGLIVYGEALEDVRPSLGDDMKMRSHANVPMAALWLWNRGSIPRPTLLGDMKGASSVAHIYGQNLAAAESMTAANSPWAFAPSDLRRVIDLEFTYGINRPVIHTSVHQPLDELAPGLTLAIFGQYFNRHESWAPLARPWVDYISRNSYLLQQGRNHADVAYFYGEEMPLTALYAYESLADTPTRYAWDFVNPDALLNLLTVSDGNLVAPSGASYEVLYLGGTSQKMTLPVLRKLAELADAGATIVGNAPVSSPSLADDSDEFATLVESLWGGDRVLAVDNVEVALESIGLAPDFAFDTSQDDSEVLFVHRLLDDGHAYFLNNRNNRPESLEARFRVTGYAPEIWHADTGTVEPVTYRIEGDVTFVPLEFGAEDSFFVVFRNPTSATSATIAKSAFDEAVSLDTDWNVVFQAGRGAPEQASLEQLASLSEHPDPGVRYFSGIATYSNSFERPQADSSGQSVVLDLGEVGDVAEVIVNGKTIGTVWKAPYRIDIGGAVTSGTNTLEVRVANLWVNRLIGDAQPGAEKIASTPAATYLPDAPLRPSGLIGPVRLLTPSGNDQGNNNE